MSGHYIELAVDHGELEIRFVCENHRGDPCHRRHEDQDVESWGPDDPLIDTDECWAMTWWDAVGLEALAVAAPDGPIARVPVDIAYDEGIVATPTPAPAGVSAAPTSRDSHVEDPAGAPKHEGTQHE